MMAQASIFSGTGVKHRLHAGDILAYSTGSAQTGPEGYRKLKGGNRILKALGNRWPDIIDALGVRPALFINAYPACIDTFQVGALVDTYLSPRALSRALQLGHVSNNPTVLLGQPLFLADALLRHLRAGRPMPKTLMLWVGGYSLPESLENMLRSILQPHVDTLHIIQFFGAAEVDACCLMARSRNRLGELIYYPREDVIVELEDEELILSLSDLSGRPKTDPFYTGDAAHWSGSGLVIRNLERLHPLVEDHLESWTEDQWKRRTGYVRREDRQLWIQLREGQFPNKSNELEHFTFAQRFGFSWLDKPYWR